MTVEVPESVDDALAIIMEGLIASSKSELYDQDRLAVAAEYCVARQFMAMGLSFEAITRNLDEREHAFRFHYSEADGLSVEVEWLDGNTEISVDLDVGEAVQP